MKRLAFAALLLAGCPHPGPAPVTPDAADAAAGGCVGACANGRRLGCAFAQPTPAGTSCETVCANFQASGIGTWDLACRSTATSCAAIDACR